MGCAWDVHTVMDLFFHRYIPQILSVQEGLREMGSEERLPPGELLVSPGELPPRSIAAAIAPCMLPAADGHAIGTDALARDFCFVLPHAGSHTRTRTGRKSGDHGEGRPREPGIRKDPAIAKRSECARGCASVRVTV